jgi:hypothetical protein
MRQQQKIPLHYRHPAGPPVDTRAFTGSGFIPDTMSEHAHTTFHAASATNLEGGKVLGKESMMPIPGNQLAKLQPGSKIDTGAGGAGSFATRSAFRARG